MRTGLRTLLLCLAIPLWLPAARGAAPSGIAALENAKTTYESLHSYQWKVAVSVKTTSGTANWERLCRRSDNRLEALDYDTSPGSEERVRTQFLWDAENLYQHEKTVPLLMVSDLSFASADFPAFFGGELDGYLGDGDYIHDLLLRNRGKVRVANQPEPVSGVACIKIEAAIPQGDFAVWLDPNAGYAYRKYEIRRGPQKADPGCAPRLRKPGVAPVPVAVTQNQ